MLWLLIGLILILILLVKRYLDKIYSYFSERGIDTPPYHYFLGNVLDQLIFKRNISEILKENYKLFTGYNYFGFYNFTNKTVVIRHPDVIQDILVKDFSHFSDNEITVHEDDDPIVGMNSFFLKGSRWKAARAQIIPSFTKNKIRKMAPLLEENKQKIVNYISKNGKELNAKELAYRITSENTGVCAFGLNAGSFDSDDAKIMVISKEIFKKTLFSSIISLSVVVFPQLTRFVKTKFFTEESVEYLTSIVKQTLKYREEHNENRNDFLDSMKEKLDKTKDESEFNMKHVVAHAGGFLLDGVETSSIVLNHLLYEIAVKKDVQEKVREEIQNVLDRHANKITSEAVDEMLYLDCVFKESLRLHPSLLFLSKQVTKDYTLGPMRDDNTGPKLKLSVGDSVLIPVDAIQQDETYFPNPLDFIPERFSPENSEKINKYTYLPFGEGPRKCVGMQFGILQLKVAVIIILMRFKMTVNKRTLIEKPITVDPWFFLNMPKGGYWLDFEKLEDLVK